MKIFNDKVKITLFVNSFDDGKKMFRVNTSPIIPDDGKFTTSMTHRIYAKKDLMINKQEILRDQVENDLAEVIKYSFKKYIDIVVEELLKEKAGE